MTHTGDGRVIRVSCAALCRIEHPGLGFFLLVNHNRRHKGLYILSPIGGALMFHDDSIVPRFNADLEIPGSADLRMNIPVEHLPAFSAWFYAAQGRETSPFRELREELVCESCLLPALAPEDVACEHLWTVEREQFTARAGQTGLLTHYFLEIYAVRFLTTAALGQLIAAPRAEGARWLSAQQLTCEERVTMTIDGEERQVEVNGRIVLEPPPAATDSP